jgi:hypothetical protein
MAPVTLIDSRPWSAQAKGLAGAIRKIDNFLTSRLGVGIVFQKGATGPARALRGDVRADFGVQTHGTTREWRLKPLKSLKTDSAVATRRLAVAGEALVEKRGYAGKRRPLFAHA